jgi:hypothetical protein
VLAGRITYADSKKPVAGGRVLAMTNGGNFRTRTDRDGRYQMPVSDTAYGLVYAAPPGGEPYLVLKNASPWPKGAVRHAVDLALPRGIVVQGEITEVDSNKPVAGANIEFFPQQTDNPGLNRDVASLWQSAVLSGPDGKFRLVVPPGKCRLLVTGPTPDYIYQEAAYSMLADGKLIFGNYSPGPEGNAYSGGQRVYSHAIVPLKIEPEVQPEPLKVSLRRGVTVVGRLVGADGKPVAQARMLSRQNVSLWDHMVGGPTRVFDGRFELHGCDPEATYRVIFFDAKNQQGAVVEIPGKKSGGEPLTVRLAPCGTAKARLIGPGGEPLRNRWVKLELIVTPGGNEVDPKQMHADAANVSNLDWLHYGLGPRSDGQGLLTLPALIPGAAYRFTASAKEFTIEPGKTVDWGDIRDAFVIED